MQRFRIGAQSVDTHRTRLRKSPGSRPTLKLGQLPQSTDAYGALTVGGLRTPAWDWGNFPESLSEQTQGVVLHALHLLVIED